MAEPKKFLDQAGLEYLASKFNDFPDNEILGVVINAIDAAKQDRIEGLTTKTLSITDGGITTNYAVLVVE